MAIMFSTGSYEQGEKIDNPIPLDLDNSNTNPHAHVYNEKHIEPNCLNSGMVIYTCECGHSYEEKESSALGHRYTATFIEATCDEGGHIIYTCITCGYEYLGNFTKKLEHIFDDWEIETLPTPNSQGIKSHECEICGYKEYEFFQCEHTDTTTKTVVQANCIKEGHINIVCSICEEIIEEKITPTTNHNFGQWKTTKLETPQEEGLQIRTCKTCAHEETKSIKFDLKDGYIYIQSANIKAKYVVAKMDQQSVDKYDIVCAYTNSNEDRPVILGHNTKSLKPLYNANIGSYIYFTRNGNIEVYQVKISEQGIVTEDKKDIEGISSKYKLLSSTSSKNMCIYTCYKTEHNKNSRWMVVANLVEIIPQN